MTIQLQTLTCTEVLSIPGRQDRYQEQVCGKDAEHECVNCGEGVCIRCTLPCYECGENLHDMCRADHAAETGHSVDIPPSETLLALLEKASREPWEAEV
jgi:hypothetical protein